MAWSALEHDLEGDGDGATLRGRPSSVQWIRSNVSGCSSVVKASEVLGHQKAFAQGAGMAKVPLEEGFDAVAKPKTVRLV